MDQPGFFGYGDASQGNPATATNSYFGKNLQFVVNNGSVPLTRVQDMAIRIMTPYYFLGQDDPSYPALNFNQLDNQ